MTTSCTRTVPSRLAIALVCGLLAIAAPGRAMAHHHHHHHHHHHGNGDDDSSGDDSRTPPSVPQHGSPPLTGLDHVYRGKDGKLHHSSDGSIATTTTVRDHRNSASGGALPVGTVVHDHRNGKDCSYTVYADARKTFASRNAYRRCEHGS